MQPSHREPCAAGAACWRQSLRTVSRYLVLPTGAADAVALWVLHAYAHDAADHSPILAIVAGKSLWQDHVAARDQGALTAAAADGQHLPCGRVSHDREVTADALDRRSRYVPWRQ